jgi:predicted O-methyltransferase YrrM
MDVRNPHRQLEDPGQEIAVVEKALAALVDAGILPHVRYDHDKFLAHRQAVAQRFEIPWTAISPRMQRLLYAINAIRRPAVMLAAGVFCGNTFISNAGAAVGPGACYTAEQLIGVEIKPEDAQRAQRNVAKVDPTGTARILAADALEVLATFGRPIDLLYLDADGSGGRGKGIYYDLVQNALPLLGQGAIVLAHNSVNGGEKVQPYLQFVRDRTNFRASINIVIDPEGLEVSLR